MIVANTDHQVTMKMFYSPSDFDLYVGDIYEKCTLGERQQLLVDLNNVLNMIQGPRCIGGALNVILGPVEKFGWWARSFHSNQVNRLGGTCFGHMPLIIKCHNDQQVNIKIIQVFRLLGWSI